MSFNYGDYEGKKGVKNIYAEMSQNSASVNDVSKIENIDLIFHEMSPQLQNAILIFGREDAEGAMDVIDRMSMVNIANAD